MRWLGGGGGKLSVQQTTKGRIGGIGVTVENEGRIGLAADDPARKNDKIVDLIQFLFGQFVPRRGSRNAECVIQLVPSVG